MTPFSTRSLNRRQLIGGSAALTAAVALGW